MFSRDRLQTAEAQLSSLPELFPTYDRASGQYRDGNGAKVGRARIRKLVDQEIGRTEARLKAHTRLLIAGKIDLPDWERRFAQTLKESHLRMAAFAGGGQLNLSSRHYGATGYQIRRQLEYLDGFAHDLAMGRLTADRALQRSAMYGKSIRTTFNRIEKLEREIEGFTVAKRSLDPQARHCASCIGYSTKGKWKPIAEVVPAGTNCECQSACRCSVVFARLSDVIQA